MKLENGICGKGWSYKKSFWEGRYWYILTKGCCTYRYGKCVIRFEVVNFLIIWRFFTCANSTVDDFQLRCIQSSYRVYKRKGELNLNQSWLQLGKPKRSEIDKSYRVKISFSSCGELTLLKRVTEEATSTVLFLAAFLFFGYYWFPWSSLW